MTSSAIMMPLNSDSSYSPVTCRSPVRGYSRPSSRQQHVEFESDLNALLADLQTTISTSNGTSSGYGSLENHHRTRGPAYKPPSSPTSPTSPRSPRHTSSSPVYQNQQEAGRQMGSFNNNLSQLDTLLQDLSSSKYVHNSDTAIVNGASTPSPRPTVDSLLDELSLANGDVSDSPDATYTKVTIEEKTTHNYVTPQTASASTATRELDDLMASLSQFKLKQKEEPPYAKPLRAKPQPNLDSMLGSLQADMNKQGVKTAQKGCCAACDKPIVGQVITALGKTWHPEHFVCAHCNQELGTKSFFERDGKPYCEADYHKLFSPTCAYCNGPIIDKCVTALDRTWHPEHFFCQQCGKQFGEDGFHEKNGKPYCRDDYLDQFAPKCGGCGQPITDNYISALNQQWHPACFVCKGCGQPMSGKNFYKQEGKMFCGPCVGVGEDDKDDAEDDDEEAEASGGDEIARNTQDKVEAVSKSSTKSSNVTSITRKMSGTNISTTTKTMKETKEEQKTFSKKIGK